MKSAHIVTVLASAFPILAFGSSVDLSKPVTVSQFQSPRLIRIFGVLGNVHVKAVDSGQLLVQAVSAKNGLKVSPMVSFQYGYLDIAATDVLEDIDLEVQIPIDFLNAFQKISVLTTASAEVTGNFGNATEMTVISGHNIKIHDLIFRGKIEAASRASSLGSITLTDSTFETAKITSYEKIVARNTDGILSLFLESDGRDLKNRPSLDISGHHKDISAKVLNGSAKLYKLTVDEHAFLHIDPKNGVTANVSDVSIGGEFDFRIPLHEALSSDLKVLEINGHSITVADMNSQGRVSLNPHCGPTLSREKNPEAD